MENLTLSKCPQGKGLVLKFIVDFNYGGFYFNLSRHRLELCIGFIALRMYFMSEARLSYLETIVNLPNICESHEITINKESAAESSVGEDKGESNE